jgi:DNA-binding IclR family transcriptional regulator
MSLADPRAAPPLAVARILRLLQVLASSSSGASLNELSEALGAPPTSLLGLLRGLTDQGYVDRERRRYRLGSQSYRLAGQILATRSIGQAARPILIELAAASGESASLDTLSDDQSEMILTEFVSGKNAIRFEATVGERHSLHTGAGGRLMLSLLPETQVADYLARSNSQALEPILQAARRDLFTATYGENVPGAAAIAAPVFDERETPIGAVLLIGPIERMRGRQGELVRLATNAGIEISRRLGSSCSRWRD